MVRKYSRSPSWMVQFIRFNSLRLVIPSSLAIPAPVTLVFASARTSRRFQPAMCSMSSSGCCFRSNSEPPARGVFRFLSALPSIPVRCSDSASSFLRPDSQASPSPFRLTSWIYSRLSAVQFFRLCDSRGRYRTLADFEPLQTGQVRQVAHRLIAQFAFRRLDPAHHAIAVPLQRNSQLRQRLNACFSGFC